MGRAKLAAVGGFADTRSRLLRLVPLLLATAVGLLTIDAGFVFDDRSALLESALVAGEAPWWEAFVRDYWGRPIEGGVNSYRPMVPIVWAWLWRVFPDSPLPFHALSILCHVLVTGLAMRVAFVLRRSEAWAVAVGAMFAVHPLNAETVGATVSQADLVSFGFVLGACLFALRPPNVATALGAAVLMVLATLAKESAIIFAPLLVLLWLVPDPRSQGRWKATLPLVAITVAVVAFQLALPRRETVALWGNTLAHEAQGAHRIWLGLYTIGRSLVMSFWPHPLAPSHGYASVELHGATLWRFATVGAVLLVVGVAAGVWAVRARRLDWVAALSFLYAPALLQSHWFVRLITDLAERLLYPATLGAAMVVAIAAFRWLENRQLRRIAVAGLVVAAFLVGVPARRAWVDNLALWTHGVRVEPKAMRHQYNLSGELIRRGELDGAAFHRLVAVYLVNRFPERVEWDSVEALEALAPEQRFVELPATLYPNQPCPVIVAFLRQNEPLPALHQHVLSRWIPRYPECFVAADSP